MSRLHQALYGPLLFTSSVLLFAADPPGKPPTGPLPPRAELATFKIIKGFKVELVACEPDVVDPVALAFDEDGRLFVAEMRGYPNGGVGTGNISSGTIRLLEDKDGDGFYETSRFFALGLRLPTSVMPYKGGLLVANAPELVYFAGPDADGKARGRRTLYTGFDLDNIQQLLNHLQWGLDNWVHACAGGKGGTIRSAEKPGTATVTLRGQGIRFQPDVPGSLESTSGGGQFGLAADEGQHWFTATNSQHLRQIVLPDQYLRRNPNLPVSAVTLDIPDHGAVCKVNRQSPFEPWRIERTTQRAGGGDSKRFSATELVPGGFITSACSPLVYTAGLFPAEFRGNTFVCEPANNLIHRDILVDTGSTFVARRGDADCEFLASTDVWFRPVALALGPDGAIYVADFYREVIETPLSLPEEIKKKYNLQSRSRGRIWRIVPDTQVAGANQQTARPSLSKAAAAELVSHLESANSWWRLTAQRLLIERQDRSALEALARLAGESKSPLGRLHALWGLYGLKGLDDSLIDKALQDPDPRVREQALRLAEDRLAGSAALVQRVAGLVNDASPRVRFQLAFTLGACESPELPAAWVKLARRDGGDPWVQTALLSSAYRSAAGLLETLAQDREFAHNAPPVQVQLLGRLAALVGARGDPAELARALGLLTDKVEPWQPAVLEGVGQGMQSSGRSLRRLWDDPPPALKPAVARTRPFFERAVSSAKDEKQATAQRLAAVRLLGVGPFAPASGVLPGLLSPSQPAELQLAALRGLAAHDQPQVASLLLSSWNSFSPSLRREAAEALLARPERVGQLLDAIEKKQVLAAHLEPARVELLRKHPDPKIRQRVQTLLGQPAPFDRQKIVEEYRAALDRTGDAAQGKAIFKKNCSTCHRLDNEGSEVGADLLAALKTKTRAGLVLDILDPSREVDPRYLNYVVSTKDGRFLTGIIAVESSASITLRRAEKAEDVILRSQIEEVQATAKSLMPDELEKQLSKQDLADLIAYLLSAAGRK